MKLFESQLNCNKCNNQPVCDRELEGGFTATCGNVDCDEYGNIDGLKHTRLQALQAWNNRQKRLSNEPN